MAELAKLKLVCSTHECKDCPLWDCCPKESVPADWNTELLVEKLKCVCPKCGQPKEPNKPHCPACLNEGLARTKMRYEQEHRCKDCGTPLPKNWKYKRCRTCLDKTNERDRRRKLKGAFENA